MLRSSDRGEHLALLFIISKEKSQQSRVKWNTPDAHADGAGAKACISLVGLYK